MTEFALGGEFAVRLAFFFGVLAAMAAWEVVAPRRALSQPEAVRWYANLGIVALNVLVLRAVLPLAPLAVAGPAAERGWGVLNLVEVPAWLAVVLALVVLDFAIYLQHVLFHAVPVLWRLHRMHHADLDFDVSSGLRFHTVETLLSALIKMAVVVVVGAPALAVLAFEVVLNATSMFNHGNVRLPAAFDGALRWLVVTPDMHRVHHSIAAEEANSNFGFCLPWWERLMGTYRAQPAAGHQGMTIGIEMFRDPGALHLHRMLVQPFLGGAGSYPTNRTSGPPAT
ncbi:MAG: sterol desaturase family protein [Rhodospirillales bacterium]|jgi:sterol desaturase/sphingolipid hydroxylase (fatty acid hydroxylase superfamily)|nr:sterol desaturase family protein [Rhodospirillales bacterium]HJO71457.1 sterol desaturase family protein [Rhodospirillales bacterium]